MSAADVPTGTFLPPVKDLSPQQIESFKTLPTFCRVQVTAQPSSDSHIEIEVWLPGQSKWNKKFRGEGNGGFAGQFDYGGLGGSLKDGYATAGTDAGHKGDFTDASWALGHPEKIIDFGYRAVHEMTNIAKEVVAAYYGDKAHYAYFDACSDGGREALMEAQRFPDDYDGILAGAPANNWTHMLVAGFWKTRELEKGRAYFIPPAKLPVLTSAALKSCTDPAGLRDGFANDPAKCRAFDPQVTLCRTPKSQNCLSTRQIETARMAYRDLRLGAHVAYPGFLPGSEAGDGAWDQWVTGKTYNTGEGRSYVLGFFRNMVYSDAAWTGQGASIENIAKAADDKMQSTLNATDPDLSRFREHGGKLILYHGWLDPAISPFNTIDYFESVEKRMGKTETSSFLRLYMVPGMRHCAGGPGPHIFGQLGLAVSREAGQNVFTSLENWVEHGNGPAAITGTKLQDDRDTQKGVRLTRLICPWRQVARFRGQGSVDDAANYTCSNEQ